MHYKRLSRRAAVALLGLLARPALAADYQWVNPQSATAQSFHVPSNWTVGGDPASVPPGSGDTVRIGAPGNESNIRMTSSVINQQLIVEANTPMLTLSSSDVTYSLTMPPETGPSVLIGGNSLALLQFSGKLVSNDALLGQQAGSMGIMQMFPASTWTANGTLTLGSAGQGWLFLDDGASVSCQQMIAGLAEGSDAYVSVGTGASLTVGGVMAVGLAGKGSMDIAEGALVSAGTAVFGSGDPYYTLTMGLGASLTVADGLYFGLSEPCDADIVGASIQAGAMAVGGSAAGALTGDGVAVVSLSGSSVVVQSLLEVSAGGVGILALSPGSTLTSQQAVIGSRSPLAPPDGVTETDRSVLMDGESSWTNTGNLIIGTGGAGNGSISLAQGAGDGPTLLVTGSSPDSMTIIGHDGVGLVEVMDAGSVWTQQGSIHVGQKSGATGRLDVISGGKVITDKLFVAGDGIAGGGFGDVLVAGLGTGDVAAKLVVNDSAVIGYGGDGALLQVAGGVMEVGGSLSLGTARPEAQGLLTLTDAGTSLRVSGALHVGVEGTGGFLVQDGASAQVGNVFVGSAATGSGTLVVDGGGSLTSTGAVYVGGDGGSPRGAGMLVVQGTNSPASLTAAGPITVWQTGIFVANHATIWATSIELYGGVLMGQGLINTPVHSTGGDVQVESGFLELSGPFAIVGGGTVHKSGGAVLKISGPQSHEAGAGIVVMAGGIEMSRDAGAAGANLALRLEPGATAMFGATQHLRDLSVSADAMASMTAGAGATLIVHGLSIDASGPVPGAVDLGKSDLVWVYGQTAGAYAQVRQWVLTGWAGGGGLLTSEASPSRLVTLAPVDNNMLHLLSWNGETISDGADFNQIIVKFTVMGDVNLDGTVDSRDLVNVVAHLNRPGDWTWFDGDVDLDGAVTMADFSLVLGQIGGGGMSLSSQSGVVAESKLVPEPGCLGLLTLAVCGLLARRRGQLLARA